MMIGSVFVVLPAHQMLCEMLYSLPQICSHSVSAIIFIILWVKQLRFSQVSQLSQGYLVSKWGSQNSNAEVWPHLPVLCTLPTTALSLEAYFYVSDHKSSLLM